MTCDEILGWLREDNPDRLASLWRAADEVRRLNVGDEVHLRGLLEISNHCRRDCAYCGIRAGRPSLARYRMTAEEILACAGAAAEFGYGTVVLQAGEDAGLTGSIIADIVAEIKFRYPLAVTLSLGERSDEELLAWRQAGADRYLLRFETSNRDLFARIHPALPGRSRDRFEMLQRLRQMGYEIGSGVMCGIPGQSYEDLAEDVLLFARLDLDMIGIGPYIPHEGTPLGAGPDDPRLPPERQAPNTELMTYKLVALARLACPQANIPSTTALATLNLASGRELGLQRGANILMPNITLTQYRRLYEIYPSKACIMETAAQCHSCMRRRIQSIGRQPGRGPGGRRCRGVATSTIELEEQR
ncbi:MAG: [FeFe] hydrogenase H-cluster radical SAM maturase HydE [Phycisphaerae bacterium]|nr:[FeFe] hydrogenase H-cluster radical SAM maturase HydE [Phycisphaerae bacterium]